VLKKGGALYHYMPNPYKTKGELFYPKMLKQLKEAGFSAEYHEKSSGIRCVKK
jgi:predicted methyltransferase